MSRTIALWILATLLILIAVTSTRATVNASFPGGGGIPTVTPLGNDHYTVLLNRTNTGSGAIEALVTGDSDDCDLEFDASFRDADHDDILNTCEVVFCRCDFNGNFVMNSQDFFEFLTCFFEECEDADWNQDSEINSQDFFEFLLCFFSGC